MPACALLLSTAACGATHDDARPLVLATTTSLYDSGFIDHVLPSFEAAHPRWRVRVLAVGSGEALELGRRGDADVLLSHAPPAESAFVAAGHALERAPVMYNRFVVVGPPGDPAAIRGTARVDSALARIRRARAPFVSRGDGSGTHLRELALWSGDPPADAGRGWYLEAGQGMAEVLRIAAERRAYALSDLATFVVLALPGLEVFVDDDPDLVNPYSVIIPRAGRNPNGAREFFEWITGPEGSPLILSFPEHLGEPLFRPGAPPALSPER